MFVLIGEVVSWKSFKQISVVRITMEVESVALKKAGFEAEWLRSLKNISLFTNFVAFFCIHCVCQMAQVTITRAMNIIYMRKVDIHD